MDIEVLIIGSDANAYYMARSCHELYNKKVSVLAQKPMSFINYSDILDITYDASIWDEEGFIKALYNFKKIHKNSKIILISSNETYVNFISKNSKKLCKDFYFNYASYNIIKSLINKENFYKTYKDSVLDLPETYYFDCKRDKKFIWKNEFPVIVKPSNVVIYNHINFEGKRKIYKLYNQEELDNTINTIKTSGYNDILIIQEYIEGDDSNLFDAVVYSNSKGNVEFISFAQIGLQEHSKNMIGNAAVLVNGFNTNGSALKQISLIKEFMESIKFTGFAEFDMKYDSKTGKYKVLEINARQGRCSYYIAGAGYNLVKVLIDDLIYNKEHKFRVLNKKVLLSFIPKEIIKKYVKNKKLKDEILKLWKNRIDPLYYSNDKNLKRKLFLLKRKFNYYKDYKNSDWDNF